VVPHRTHLFNFGERGNKRIAETEASSALCMMTRYSENLTNQNAWWHCFW
jgi:hypothetical protein